MSEQETPAERRRYALLHSATMIYSQGYLIQRMEGDVLSPYGPDECVQIAEELLFAIEQREGSGE